MKIFLDDFIANNDMESHLQKLSAKNMALV